MFSVFLTLCVLMSALFGVFADDAAGLLCVRVETNGNAVVEMPFAPYGNAKPDAFLSGPFVDGGGVDPDRLYVLTSNSLTYTNAVYSQFAGWLDPATGEPTPMTASQGDTVVFAPSLCGTNEPFSFFLYGQEPCLASYAGAPRIRSMTVDPFGAFAELSVFSRGLTTDLYLSDFSTNASESTLWRHMGRYPGCPMSFSWRDSTLPSSGGRIYLASDATLDPDGDGLTCLKEFELGTDPRNPDIDGDGIPDGWEVDNGMDPFTSDASQDPDSDGLTNIEEMFYGTDPHLADTDNDGVRDAEECKGFFSDPLNPDFDGTAVTNMVIHAVAVDSAIGDWYANEDCVMLSGRTGEVFYDNDLIIENAGFYQIRAMVSSRLATDAEFVCRVDGCRVGTVRLPSSKSELTADAVYNLPWISAGVHTLSFELQNFANSAEFGLGDICVCSIGGPDSDANGVADWMDSRYDFTGSERGVAIRSKVSPFWMYYTLEGKYYESQRLEDGTRVVENRLSAFDLPDAVEFRMTSSSGICFENGSGRLTVAPSDFDGYGDFRYRFLVPSGVDHPCQFLHGYFQGKEFAQ